MANYLDKTGLAYFWGKVKEKLNKKADKASLDSKADKASLDSKADNDKYKILNISTNKIKIQQSATSSDGYYTDSLLLDKPNFNNFAETFPSGYHIMCILAVKLIFFANETNYNYDVATDVLGGYSIMPIQYVNSIGYQQEWSVPQEPTIQNYGSRAFYTLLIEKD